MPFKKGHTFHLGKKRTSEQKERMSIAGKKRYIEGNHPFTKYQFIKGHKQNLGRIRSDEERKSISIGHLGQIPWNKGKGIKKAPDVYPKQFRTNIFREDIKKRDNYACQCCGVTEEEHLIVFGRGLSLHHIDYIKENISKDNLVSVCNQCNVRANFNKSYWVEFYTHLLPNVLKGTNWLAELRPMKIGAL